MICICVLNVGEWSCTVVWVCVLRLIKSLREMLSRLGRGHLPFQTVAKQQNKACKATGLNVLQSQQHGISQIATFDNDTNRKNRKNKTKCLKWLPTPCTNKTEPKWACQKGSPLIKHDLKWLYKIAHTIKHKTLAC